MRPYVSPYSAKAYQPIDITFEPEEEAMCDLLSKGRPELGATIVGALDALDTSKGELEAVGQAWHKEVVASEYPKKVVRPFGSARQLLAKHAVKPKPTLGSGAHFEHLTCCFENAQLMDRLAHVEQDLHTQSRELLRLNRARDAEVMLLTAELSDLQEGKPQYDDALVEKHSDAKMQQLEKHECAKMQELEVEGAQIEAQELRQRFIAQQSVLEQMQQQLLQVQREAADHRAKLSVYRETHEQEVSELRWQLESGSRRLPRLQSEAEGAKRKAAELEISLQVLTNSLNGAVQRRKDAEQLLYSEQMHCQLEIEHFNKELRDACAAARNLPQDGPDETIRALQSAVDELQADKTLREFQEQRLLEQCTKLYGPCSTLMAMFGEAPLPPLPGLSAKDLSGNVQWLQALGKQMGDLREQLQARVHL